MLEIKADITNNHLLARIGGSPKIIYEEYAALTNIVFKTLKAAFPVNGETDFTEDIAKDLLKSSYAGVTKNLVVNESELNSPED